MKLPPTLAVQYWSLVSVGPPGQASIQCPDSSLVLKCAILQQAATLATATSTTVRIPIPVADQDHSFGVYAVPGLKTHVFVGPFKSKENPMEVDEDVVCLDDNDEVVKAISAEAKSSKKTAKIEETKKRKVVSALVHKARLLGQTPQVVAREEIEDGSDVEIIDQIEQPGKNVAKQVKSQLLKAAETASVEQASARPSEHGKIVIRQRVGSGRVGGTPVEVRYVKPIGPEEDDEEEAVYKAVIETSGKVSLAHPSLPDHAVICPSVPAAKLWLENYFEEAAENPDEEQLFEETPELPEIRSSTPPPVLKLIQTPSLPSGRTTDHISLFLQTREQKNEAALFYELGHTAFTQFFQKTISRAQILVKAKQEIHGLEEEGRELEASKAALLKRRSKLFDDFTKSLTGLPVARKKTAVMELKELLKRDKDSPEAARSEPSPAQAEPQSSAPASRPLVVSSAASPTPYTDVTGENWIPW